MIISNGAEKRRVQCVVSTNKSWGLYTSLSFLPYNYNIHGKDPRRRGSEQLSHRFRGRTLEVEQLVSVGAPKAYCIGTVKRHVREKGRGEEEEDILRKTRGSLAQRAELHDCDASSSLLTVQPSQLGAGGGFLNQSHPGTEAQSNCLKWSESVNSHTGGLRSRSCHLGQHYNGTLWRTKEQRRPHWSWSGSLTRGADHRYVLYPGAKLMPICNPNTAQICNL